MKEDKWNYIMKISQMGDKYGNLLLDFMNKYNLNNLYTSTYEQAKEYYIELISGKYKE